MNGGMRTRSLQVWRVHLAHRSAIVLAPSFLVEVLSGLLQERDALATVEPLEVPSRWTAPCLVLEIPNQRATAANVLAGDSKSTLSSTSEFPAWLSGVPDASHQDPGSSPTPAAGVLGSSPNAAPRVPDDALVFRAEQTPLSRKDPSDSASKRISAPLIKSSTDPGSTGSAVLAPVFSGPCSLAVGAVTDTAASPDSTCKAGHNSRDAVTGPRAVASLFLEIFVSVLFSSWSPSEPILFFTSERYQRLDGIPDVSSTDQAWPGASEAIEVVSSTSTLLAKDSCFPADTGRMRYDRKVITLSNLSSNHASLAEGSSLGLSAERGSPYSALGAHIPSIGLFPDVCEVLLTAAAVRRESLLQHLLPSRVLPSATISANATGLLLKPY